MVPKVFGDIPDEDLKKLESMLEDTFNEVYPTCDSYSSLDYIASKVYYEYQTKINEAVKEDKKFFKTKFLDIINADDYEFQKFVNRYIKKELN